MRNCWLFALLAVAACGAVKSPAQQDAGACQTHCSDAGTPDAPDPVSYPPAAVWIAPGGTGTATSHAQVNASFGSVYGAGTATAPSGATLTTGFLGTDTN